MERRASLRGVQLGVVQLEVGRVAASTLERCGVVSSATVRHVHAAVSSSAPAGDDAAQHAAAELQSMMINFKDFPSQASSFPRRAGTTRETKHHG